MALRAMTPPMGPVLIVAGNKVFRSTDRGDSWTAISPDLTQNFDRENSMIMGMKNSDVRIAKNDGIASWPAITSVADSAKMPGLYYAGTDDGTVSVSKDGGKTWDKTLANRMPGFVKGGFVSRIQASRFDAQFRSAFIEVAGRHRRFPESHEVALAAAARGGHGNAVRIVAVTKTHGADAVLAALENGLTDIGENKVQAIFPRLHVGLIPWVEIARAGFPARIFDNMNTPQDYEIARRQLAT